MQAFLQGCGQGLQQIKQSRGAGEGGDADVHALAVTEELAGEGQQDQGNGRGIQEHQHRQGIVQDLAQAEIGHHKGEQGEDDCPGLVGQSLGEHPLEGIGAAGDQADGSLQTGEGDGQGQDDAAERPQVMAGNLGQGDAAVVGGLKQATGLGAHEDGQHIDQSHQSAGEDAGLQHILGNGGVLFHTHAADDVDDHDAEGQARNGIHGAVAFHEAGEESTGLISCCRFHGRYLGAGIQQGGDDQDGQECQEQGIDDLADPDGDARGPQGEEQHQSEENGGKDQQSQSGIVSQHRLDAGGEGGGGTSGNGKEGTDGQIQQTGEEVAVALAYLIGQSLQAVGVGNADGGHTQNGDAHGGDDEADHGACDIAACQLAQVNREDQVACAEEHAEQGAGHQ